MGEYKSLELSFARGGPKCPIEPGLQATNPSKRAKVPIGSVFVFSYGVLPCTDICSNPSRDKFFRIVWPTPAISETRTLTTHRSPSAEFTGDSSRAYGETVFPGEKVYDVWDVIAPFRDCYTPGID